MFWIVPGCPRLSPMIAYKPETMMQRGAVSMEVPYDESALQSLLGYGHATHERSGGVCQLCGCGAGPDIDFDLWRQFTIEHLIGKGQGGYLPQIKFAVEVRFAHLAAEQ